MIYIPNSVPLAIIGNIAASLLDIVSGFSPDSCSKSRVIYTIQKFDKKVSFQRFYKWIYELKTIYIYNHILNC